MSTPDDLTNDATASGAIWNPSATAKWSLLFTPAFGAYLQMLNWRALGEPQRAAGSRKWFIVGVGLFAVYTTIAFLISDVRVVDGVTQGIAIAYLLAWYFASSRAHAEYVHTRLGITYARKPWGKALLYAVGAIVAYWVVVFVVAVVIEIARAVGNGV